MWSEKVDDLRSWLFKELVKSFRSPFREWLFSHSLLSANRKPPHPRICVLYRRVIIFALTRSVFENCPSSGIFEHFPVCVEKKSLAFNAMGHPMGCMGGIFVYSPLPAFWSTEVNILLSFGNLDILDSGAMFWFLLAQFAFFGSCFCSSFSLREVCFRFRLVLDLVKIRPCLYSLYKTGRPEEIICIYAPPARAHYVSFSCGIGSGLYYLCLLNKRNDIFSGMSMFMFPGVAGRKLFSDK